MRRLPAVAVVIVVLILLAPPVLAQDVLIQRTDKGANRIEGEVLEINYHSVVMRQQVSEGSYVNQSFSTGAVIDLELNSSQNMPYKLLRGIKSIESADYENGIKFLEGVTKEKVSSRASDVAKQYAHWHIVQAYRRMGDDRKLLQAVEELRGEYPEGYFLRGTYDLEYQMAMEEGDPRKINSAIGAFRAKGAALGDKNVRAEWKKIADIREAQLLEFQDDHRRAMNIYRTYANDKSMRDEARLGELRCLTAMQQWNDVRAKAAPILLEASEAGKKKEPFDLRLLMAAHVGLGDSEFHGGGSTKKALLDYLRVVVELGPSYGGSTPEHEAAIAMAAIASARFAVEKKDILETRQTYIGRAESLLAELRNTYSSRSRWIPKVEEAIDTARKTK